MNNVVNQKITLTPQDSLTIKRNGETALDALSYTEFKKAVLTVAKAMNVQTFSSVGIDDVNVAGFDENEGFVFLDYATDPGASTPVYLPVASHAGQKISLTPFVADASTLTGLAVHVDEITTVNITVSYEDITFIADETFAWRRF